MPFGPTGHRPWPFVPRTSVLCLRWRARTALSRTPVSVTEAVRDPGWTAVVWTDQPRAAFRDPGRGGTADVLDWAHRNRIVLLMREHEKELLANYNRSQPVLRRHGTIAYLAAYDVHRSQVMGRCEETTGIRPFTALVDQVMATEPCASAKRVSWVVDNGAPHRNWAAAARLSDAYPNAQMVRLPVHASWLSQVHFSALAAQGPRPRRLRGPQRGRHGGHRLREAPQRRRQALRLAVHPRQPQPAPGPHPPARPPHTQARGRVKPDELTVRTTMGLSHHKRERSWPSRVEGSLT